MEDGFAGALADVALFEKQSRRKYEGQAPATLAPLHRPPDEWQVGHAVWVFVFLGEFSEFPLGKHFAPDAMEFVRDGFVFSTEARPRRVAEDELELPTISLEPTRIEAAEHRAFLRVFVVAAIEKNAALQVVEAQLVRRSRLRIELDGGEVKTQRGEAERRLADVKAAQLVFENGADCFPLRSLPSLLP